MISVSRIALGAALSLGVVALALHSPVGAQGAAVPKAPALTKEERAAILPLQTAVTARNWAAAQAALPAAEAGSRSAEARHITASMRLATAIGMNDVRAQRAAIDAMIASGQAPADALPQLYKSQGILAASSNELDKADAAYVKWIEVAPNDPMAYASLAELKDSRKKPVEALRLLEQAIAVRRAAGQPIEESWYKRVLKLAYDGKIAPQSLAISRDLVAAYPTPTNWRDAITVYRDLGVPDEAATIDALRLARATKSLAGERDYLEFAEQLNKRGFPGEAQMVLDEGVAARMVDADKPAFKTLMTTVGKSGKSGKAALAADEKAGLAAATGERALKAADAHYGYGEYAKAATLYRAALQKGGVDAALVNTRLGAALAMAGQKVEAEAAFKAVTGPRTALASYWMVWLGQRA